MLSASYNLPLPSLPHLPPFSPPSLISLPMFTKNTEVVSSLSVHAQDMDVGDNMERCGMRLCLGMR